jgi:hypothetical protein
MKTAIATVALCTGAAAATTVPLAVSQLQQLGASHPTLSNRWTALVYEDELGWVIESYKMIDNYNRSVPSAKWTNFTDHSCEELIYVTGDDEIDGRYLLKCDAIDCCKEEQDGNHVEYVATVVRLVFTCSVFASVYNTCAVIPAEE